MKITIDIPTEYEKHFNKDRFKDSLERLKRDAGTFCLAGKCEIELCEMLIGAFENAETVKRGRWEYDKERDQHFCSMCGIFTIYSYLEEEIMSKYCSECGAEMVEDKDIKPAAKRGDAPAEQLGLAPST